MHKRCGFTLIEVIMTAGLLTIVSALGLVAIQSSARAVELNQAMGLLQQDARNLMMALSREIEFAVKPAPTGFSLPPNVQGIRVIEDGRAVVFQTPTNQQSTVFSAPITFRFETEDIPVSGFEFGNAILDAGEDLDGDGVLSRRVVRVQSGETRVVAGANTIAFAAFELRDNGAILRVTLTATTRISPLQERLAQYTLQSDVYLMN